MGVVAFDHAAWLRRYPEFISVPAASAQGYFNDATIYQDNTDSSPVADLGLRSVLLNMLTAHIAALSLAAASNSSGLVGRVSDASEGSVSVSASFIDAKSQLEAWANQTQYGAAWWAATPQGRRFVYRPAARACFGRLPWR